MRTRAERRHLKRKIINRKIKEVKESSSGYRWWVKSQDDVIDEIKRRGKKSYKCRCCWCMEGRSLWRRKSAYAKKEGIQEYLNHDTWEEITDEMEGVWAYNDEFFSKYSAYDANAFDSQYD